MIPASTPATSSSLLTCTWTEFIGHHQLRRVCGSTDRVRPVQTSDNPGFIEDLCFQHAIPYTYEKTFDEALEEDLVETVGGDSPKAKEIRRLREEARMLRNEYALDKRRTRLLQEERELREQADQLQDELLRESAEGVAS